MSFNTFIKIGVIILAILQPLIILYFCGEIESVSNSWQTNLQPLYIITNATTSYFLYSVKKWKMPALFLLLLTSFSIDFTPVTHNIFASLFFISCLIPLYSIHRFRHYMWLFIGTTAIIKVYNYFWFEFAAIWVLCFYHLNLMWETRNLKK